jgi:hypothetical protein
MEDFLSLLLAVLARQIKTALEVPLGFTCTPVANILVVLLLIALIRLRVRVCALVEGCTLAESRRGAIEVAVVTAEAGTLTALNQPSRA